MDEIDQLLDKAKALFDKGQYKAIIELLPDNLLDKYNNAGLYIWCYEGYYGLSELDKAINCATKAIAAEPTNYFYYFKRAFAWQIKNEYDKAIDDYNEAIKFGTGQPQGDLYYNRGLMFYGKKEYDNALADYDNALKSNEDPDFYTARGVIWYNKNEFDKAIDDYDKAIGIKEKDALAYSNRGAAYFAKTDFQKAIEDYKEAILLDKRFNFLEDNIKRAKEKLEERKTIDQSNAEPSDKKEKITIDTEIDILINTIRDLSKSEVKTVVHYTKVMVADIYVKSKNAKMHYSNAIYMNDPMEGKIFFTYLNDEDIEEAYYNGEKRTETSVYLGSFLPAEENDGKISHEDELVMWRTYGKDEAGREAAGCSILLDSNFFKMPKTKPVSSNDKETPTFKDRSEELLNVVYIKHQRDQKKITNDTKGRIEAAMKSLKQQLIKIIRLRNKYDRQNDFYKEIENTIFKQLSTISYLFKSADYDFEHEVRVITYMPRDSDSIKFREMTEANSPCKRFHIESYNDILPFVKKIYLGPKVVNDQQWSLYFDYEIRQRAKETAALTPPPYVIKASDIEIMKSDCRFQ